MKTFITRFLNRALLISAGFMSANLASAQCTAPTLTFHSPVLLSGTNGQVGAIYNFANVAPGLDAHIEVIGIYGGATLFNIDDTAGVGYYNAFQPYVGAGANDTSYIDWRITFKLAGTNIDTTLPCLAVTGVDVDGDGANLKEFIEAATPGSFSIAPNTNLTVSFDGVRSKAISPVANIALIDTNHLEAMFQMNFVNINTLDYRNGAITTAGAQVRQTCIYFKPFFDTYILLPTTLLSFSASAKENIVSIRWTATDEGNLQHYTLQRSTNGRAWTNIGNIRARNSHTVNDYVVSDFSDFSGTVYFRLMEVLKNGGNKLSTIVKVSPSVTASATFAHSTMFNQTIRLQTTMANNEEYDMSVYTINGQPVFHQKYSLHAGINSSMINMPSSSNSGIYFLVVKTASGQPLYQAKLIKTH